MKPLKFLSVLMCEYVAEGSRGKHTIINVYTGDIKVKALPAAFPIGLYVEMEPQAGQQSDFLIEVQVGDEVVGKLRGEFPPFQSGLPALATVPQIAVTVSKDTTIKIYAVTPGFRRSLAIEKKVIFDPSVM